ncbi:MAG TPA: sigma-70 family RNA polymerase sigma factor [Nocardioidaceae bacterium]|nr:sigma-70 family RNA polymerase sigma factor [Nocardioidaceae bacterium]
MDSARVAELVAQAAAGNADAWNALVDAYGGLVWSIARSEVSSASDAADVSQTTWLRLFEHIGRLKDPTRAGAWLATTARREARRVAGRARRTLPTEDTSLPEPRWYGDGDVDEELLSRERAEDLHDALEQLPEPNQKLMRLLMQEPPMSYAAIAEALRMPIGSIGPTRARCLRKLEALLAYQAAPSRL